jgi:hypothetical protein
MNSFIKIDLSEVNSIVDSLDTSLVLKPIADKDLSSFDTILESKYKGKVLRKLKGIFIKTCSRTLREYIMKYDANFIGLVHG